MCVRARSCVLCAALGLRMVFESGRMRAIAHCHKNLDYDASFLLEFSHSTLLPRLTHFQVSALHKIALRDIRIAMRSSCFVYQRSHASGYWHSLSLPPSSTHPMETNTFWDETPQD